MFLSEGPSSPPRNERGFVRHRGLQPVSLLVIIFRIMAWRSMLTKSWRCPYNMWLLVCFLLVYPPAVGRACLQLPGQHCHRYVSWFPASIVSQSEGWSGGTLCLSPSLSCPPDLAESSAVFKQTSAQTSTIIISLHLSIKLKLPPALNVQPRLYVLLLKPGSTSPPYCFNIKHLHKCCFPFVCHFLVQTFEPKWLSCCLTLKC